MYQNNKNNFQSYWDSRGSSHICYGDLDLHLVQGDSNSDRVPEAPNIYIQPPQPERG
jgi:hypothetical protein